MPSYRYYTMPMLLSDAVSNPIVELDMSSVTLDRALGQPGNFNGTIRLGTGTRGIRDENIISGTTPGLYQICVKRNNRLIWAGPIWSQTYESEGQTMQITAQTWESIWSKVPLLNGVAYATQTIHAVMTGIFASIAGQKTTRNDFDIQWFNQSYPGALPTFSIRHTANELVTVDTVLDEAFSLTRMIPTIIFQTPTDELPNIFYTGYAPGLPSLVTPGNVNMFLEYPGSIAAYWFPANAGQGGTQHIAQGMNGVIAQADTDMALGAPWGWPSSTSSWPYLTSTRQWPNINNMTDLQNLANWAAIVDRAPKASPTFRLANPNNFDDWENIGKQLQYRIRDARFPAGLLVKQETFSGWSLTPEASDSTEVIQITTLGDGVADV